MAKKFFEIKKAAGFLQRLLCFNRKSKIRNRQSIRSLRAFDGTLFHPRHHGAELGTGLFNRMLLAFLEQRVVTFVAAFVFRNPFARKFAGLNVQIGRAHV